MITGSVDQLRRLTNEPSASGTYTNAVLSEYLAQYDGEMYAAASQIWTEKASALAGLFNHSADGERMEVTQKREFAEKMAAYYANKRIPRTSRWVKAPEETSDSEDLQ